MATGRRTLTAKNGFFITRVKNQWVRPGSNMEKTWFMVIEHLKKKNN